MPTLRLWQNKAGAAQGAGHPDERQADERRGVTTLDALEERDAEPLGAKAAGAVERALAFHVALDLLAREAAEKHRRGVDMQHADAGLRSNDRASGMKACARAARRGELRAAPGGIARLVEDPAANGGDLVAADDHGVRVTRG